MKITLLVIFFRGGWSGYTANIISTCHLTIRFFSQLQCGSFNIRYAFLKTTDVDVHDLFINIYNKKYKKRIKKKLGLTKQIIN